MAVTVASQNRVQVVAAGECSKAVLVRVLALITSAW